VQTNWVCPSEAQRFSKNDFDSSLGSLIVTRVIRCNTWLESSHHFSQLDSSLVQATKNRESSRVIDSSHAITAIKNSPQELPDLCTPLTVDGIFPIPLSLGKLPTDTNLLFLQEILLADYFSNGCAITNWFIFTRNNKVNVISKVDYGWHLFFTTLLTWGS